MAMSIIPIQANIPATLELLLNSTMKWPKTLFNSSKPIHLSQDLSDKIVNIKVVTLITFYIE